MPSRSAESPRRDSRSRSRSRSRTPVSVRSRSPRRSISPRSADRSRSRSRTPTPRAERYDRRNGGRRSASRTPSPAQPRSRSRSVSRDRGERGGGARGYSRSPARGGPPPRSAKVRSSALISLHAFGSHFMRADVFFFQIVIEKLTKNVTEAHLREIFAVYGSIQDLDMPMNRQCERYASTSSSSSSLIPLLNSHDQPRHRLHPLQHSHCRRISHRAHARSPTRRRRPGRIHRPAQTPLLALPAASPCRSGIFRRS